MSSLSVGSRLRVVYDFQAEEAEEMTVSVGEVVHVADVSALGEGWVRVRSLAGHTGLVPVDYVEQSAPAPSTLYSNAAQTAGSSIFVPTQSSASSSSTAAAADRLGVDATRTPARGGGVSASTSATSPPSAASLAAAGGATPNSYPNSANFSATTAAALPAALHPDYAHLLASHEEWFRVASSKRQEVYRGLQGEAMDLLRALTEAESRATVLRSHMTELDALITEERQKWAAK